MSPRGRRTAGGLSIWVCLETTESGRVAAYMLPFLEDFDTAEQPSVAEFLCTKPKS